jgi:hypothetical protein
MVAELIGDIEDAFVAGHAEATNALADYSIALDLAGGPG